jgi:hypothetical protein
MPAPAYEEQLERQVVEEGDEQKTRCGYVPLRVCIYQTAGQRSVEQSGRPGENVVGRGGRPGGPAHGNWRVCQRRVADQD